MSFDNQYTLSRREMLKVSLVVGGAVLIAPRAAYADLIPRPTGGLFDDLSPAIVDPFTDELRPIQFKTPLADAADLELIDNGGAKPNGTVYPQITGADALTTYRNSLERIVALQQRNSGNNVQFPPQVFYVLKVREARHAFHIKPPYSAGSVIWGYDGEYPGPIFKSYHDKPLLVRIINEIYELYFDEDGNPRPGKLIPGRFGDPRISTHLHNGHTASESDGNPADVYPPIFRPNEQLHIPEYPNSIKNLRFRDHHYAMFRAGLNPERSDEEAAPNASKGDVAESLSTLWYHDHSIHRTSPNTYKGLVGVHLVFDEIDTGNENDPAPALKLPSGKFDIPLIIQDKQFRLVDNGTGEMVAELHLPDTRPLGHTGGPVSNGFLGDMFAVNGQLKPKLSVSRRKYRFRLVNAGPSRFYQFYLSRRQIVRRADGEFDFISAPDDQSFIQIGNDESLLEKPYHVPAVDGLLVSVSERADIVIDFSNYVAGDTLFLVNRLIMEDGGEGPSADIRFVGGQPRFFGYNTVQVNGNEDPGDYIMMFEVTNDSVNDPNDVPSELRKSPELPSDLTDPVTNMRKSPAELSRLPNHRYFEFTQDGPGGQEWVINGHPFHASPAGAATRRAGRLDVPRNSLVPGDDGPDGEIWTISNANGGWAHPVHIHLEEFRILWRKIHAEKDDSGTIVLGPGTLPEEYEKCKKDVLRLDPLETVQIYIRFRDFLGKYPIHCHNVLHEDHEMMLRFDVVGDW